MSGAASMLRRISFRTERMRRRVRHHDAARRRSIATALRRRVVCGAVREVQCVARRRLSRALRSRTADTLSDGVDRLGIAARRRTNCAPTRGTLAASELRALRQLDAPRAPAGSTTASPWHFRRVVDGPQARRRGGDRAERGALPRRAHGGATRSSARCTRSRRRGSSCAGCSRSRTSCRTRSRTSPCARRHAPRRAAPERPRRRGAPRAARRRAARRRARARLRRAGRRRRRAAGGAAAAGRRRRQRRRRRRGRGRAAAGRAGRATSAIGRRSGAARRRAGRGPRGRVLLVAARRVQPDAAARPQRGGGAHLRTPPPARGGP